MAGRNPCQNNAIKTSKPRSQSVLPRMVSHGDKGRRPKNRAPLPLSAQVSLTYSRGHMQCRERLCLYVVFRYGLLLFCTHIHKFPSHFCGLYLVFSLFHLSCVILQAAVHSRSRQSPGRHGTELAHLHNKCRSSGPCYERTLATHDSTVSAVGFGSDPCVIFPSWWASALI